MLINIKVVGISAKLDKEFLKLIRKISCFLIIGLVLKFHAQIFLVTLKYLVIFKQSNTIYYIIFFLTSTQTAPNEYKRIATYHFFSLKKNLNRKKIVRIYNFKIR